VKTVKTTAMRCNGYILKAKRKYSKQMRSMYTYVPNFTIINMNPDAVSSYKISKITWAGAKAKYM
jgi:hypothetical protein